MRDASETPVDGSAYARGILEEALYAIGEAGHEGYLKMIKEYDGPKLAALLDLLSQEAHRRGFLEKLYERNEPKTACELKKELDSALRVNPLDMPWISRHYYTWERKLAAEYDGRMVDYQALLRAKVQLRKIESKARLLRRLRQTD